MSVRSCGLNMPFGRVGQREFGTYFIATRG